ncbi:MAG: hypothetical protein LBS96_02590 [Oscillospiraceae bacterium]|jgi:hypothetical protein|nr:hypothetical protein [Oscillospiraceae bacterium]
MHDETFDALLRTSLRSNDAPGDALNSKLKSRMMEGTQPMKTSKKPLRFAALAAALLCAFAVTAFAVSRLLSAEKAAELFAPEIAEAFRAPDAMVINQTQTAGAYEITLLGVAPARDLAALEVKNDGQSVTEEEGVLYAVVAVRRADGAPLAEEEFYLWPLIKGLKPWQNGSFAGGHTAAEKDGVRYYLVSCEKLSPFADRGVYLNVSDQPFYAHEMYTYDEATGDFAPNPAYAGVRVLFPLPLDSAKADPALAQRILEEKNGVAEDTEEPTANTPPVVAGEGFAVRVETDGTEIYTFSVLD